MACNPPYKRGSGSWCDCNCHCIHPDCYEEIILYYNCVPVTPTPTPTPTPASTNPIIDADFIVVRYKFDDGSDLDTRTSVSYGTETGTVVGWCKGSSYKNWYTWGGDNTGTGYEAVVIYLKQIRESNPGYQGIICGTLSAFWYGTRASGSVNLELAAYKGGSMSQSGFDWQNSGGTLVATLNKTENIKTNIKDCVDGELVTNFSFYPDNRFSWESCGSPPPSSTPASTPTPSATIPSTPGPTPTKPNCELRMTLITDGCCIEYDAGTLYTVGEGYLDLSISADNGNLKNCCDKFNINGSEFSGSNNISIFLPDGEEIIIEPDNECYCEKIDEQTAKNNFLSQCNAEPLSLLNNKKPYRIFKNLETGNYEIYFN